MDYGGKYLKIRKAVCEAGFDEFYQAGSVNRFHKMNIVCESRILGKRFWACISGGYGVKDELYIVCRNLSQGGQEERTHYGTQGEMAKAIDDIGKQIRAARAHEKEEVS